MAPALVLLHGFTHTGSSWDAVIAALGERYRSLAPDIRGHGSSSTLTPVTLEAVVEDLAESAPQRFTLAGYSMGGRIALHAALALPGRVERLVLIGATPGIRDPVERRARVASDERLAAELERSTIEEFARRWAENPVLAGQPQHVRRALHAERLRNSPAALARALRGLGAGALRPVWDRLSELRMPVVLITGSRDEKFTAVAQEMASAIRCARHEVISGSGHAAHLETPERVAAIIGTT